MKACEAQEATQYISKKGKIIEIKPLCSKKLFGTMAIPNSVPYRTVQIGRIAYGWLPPDYELELVEESKKIVFEEKVKKSTSEKPTRVKVEKIKKEKIKKEKIKKEKNDKPKSFSIFKYVMAHVKLTEAEIINQLEKARADGVSLRCKGSFDNIVKNYKKYWTKQMETINE